MALDKAQSSCYTTGDPAACATAASLQRKDELSDKLLTNAVASCIGEECNDVANFIQNQIGSLGCTAPRVCPDYDTLNSYWAIAQEKAQGLEPVYPEGWVLDGKAALDLGRFGFGALTGAVGPRRSLDALRELAKTDATKVTNTLNAEGASIRSASLNSAATGEVSAALARGVVPQAAPVAVKPAQMATTGANSGLNITSDIAPTTKGLVQYGPLSDPGPLPPTIASTFRSGTYAETVTTEPTVLYRVYGGTADQLGGYWTTTPPSGPVQSIIDSALNPAWGNPATSVVKIEIPAGVRLYQGQAAAQGGLVGGGNQVLFPKNVTIDPAWIKP